LKISKILVLILASALVAGGAVLVYQRVLGPSVDHPLADFLPEDTLAYLSVSDLNEIAQEEIAAMRPNYPNVEQDLTRLMDKVLQLAAKAANVNRDSLKNAVTRIRSIDVAIPRATADGPQLVALVESTDLLSGWDLWSSLLNDGVLKKEEDFEGHAIYSSRPLSTASRQFNGEFSPQTFRVYVGLLDKRLLATIWTDPSPLREVIAATTRPPARSLANQPTYSRLAAELGRNSHYWIYVAGPPVIKTLEAFAGPAAQRDLETSEPVAGWSRLEAATWGAILEKGWAQGYFNVHSSSPTPWYEAFHTPPTPRDLLRGVPSGSVMAVDVGLGDAADLWKRVYSYLRQVIQSSSAGRPNSEQRALRELDEMEKFFGQEFPQTTGFAFEDLIATIGDEACFAIYPASGGVQLGRPGVAPFNFLLSVRVKNSAKAKEIENLLREKVRGEAQWEQFQHGNAVVHTFSDTRSGGVPTFAYVLSENTFLLASSPEVAKASLDASSRGDGLYADEAVASGLNRLPKAASAIMLVDYSAYFQLLADAMREPVPADLKGLPLPPTVVALVEDPARLSFVSYAPRGYGWNESLVGVIEKALDEALAQQERRDWQQQPGQ
jgi:hypothetical protein